jgi:hypothetical protein
MEDPRKLRELACWHREFAERAGNPAIWEARLPATSSDSCSATRLRVAPGDDAAGSVRRWGNPR